MFKMPIWEIEDKFTKSELVLLGWRSQEQNYYMKLRMEETREHNRENKATQFEKFKRKTASQRLGDAIKQDIESMDGENVPDNGEVISTDKKAGQKLVEKLRNKEGEMDLRKATGEEARKIFSILGMPLPIMTK